MPGGRRICQSREGQRRRSRFRRARVAIRHADSDRRAPPRHARGARARALLRSQATDMSADRDRPVCEPWRRSGSSFRSPSRRSVHYPPGTATSSSIPSPSVTETAQALLADASLRSIQAEIEKRHDESVGRLQEWVKHPALAAEDRGVDEGCELMMRLARDAGFQKATRIDTDGHPGVFATLDAGAATTVAGYFMYDVKQADPAEWSSPPFDAAIVDKPGFGKVLVGRGAVNQKGPQTAFLAALHAIRGAGKKIPVNLVLVAEGEEESGSPHFRQVVANAEVRNALKRTIGVFMPSAFQDPDGSVAIFLAGKGVVDGALVDGGEE